MMLCSNRPDGGFGPYFSGDGVHVLSSCFDDTVLIPLGAWIFLLFTLVLTALKLSRRGEGSEFGSRSNKHANGDIPLGQLGETDSQSRSPAASEISDDRHRSGLHHVRGKWPKTRRFLLVVCTLLLIALFAMHALEIARLSANHQGIGLLPFAFVPLVIVLLSLWVRVPTWSIARVGPARPHGWSWLIVVCTWAVYMAVAEGVKLWSYSKVQEAIGSASYNGPDVKYPYSDKIVDSIVILCVYYSFSICYYHQIFLEYRKDSTRWRF